MKNATRKIACFALVLLTGMSQAELVDRGNGTLYDTVQNITWLKDWNINGLKTFSEQTAWAQNLTFAGASDWSLPTISQYLSIGAEVNYGKTLNNPFTNIELGNYFSSTEVSPNSINVWTYSVLGDREYKVLKGQKEYATAIHPGDLATSVPEPATLSLSLAGVALALSAAARSRSFTNQEQHD